MRASASVDDMMDLLDGSEFELRACVPADATNVLGLNGATGNFTYRNESGAPQTLVASATTDYTATFTCVCQNCGPTIEAIFQPIGRAICKTVNQVRFHPVDTQQRMQSE
eukprot:SAG31_NODE_3474_length_4233_cov_5.560716_5_plen_110_part_00